MGTGLGALRRNSVTTGLRGSVMGPVEKVTWGTGTGEAVRLQESVAVGLSQASASETL
jgi:hypothetical protein